MSAPAKEDPGRLELRAKPKPVTRLNRTTLAVLVGVLGVLVLFSTLWGLRTPSAQKVEETPAPKNVERVARPEGLSALPKDYASIPPPRLGPPAGELGRPLVRAEREAGIELPERSGFHPDPEEDALRAARLREQKEAEDAQQAQVLYPLKRSTGAPPAPGSTVGESGMSDLDLLRALSPASGDTVAAADSNKQDRKEAFIRAEPDSSHYASASLQLPRSPYQLQAGWTIPAALVTGINSDLPGDITARVTENVYDSATGQHLLIPQGSTLTGQYDSQVAYGQRRVLLVWNRLIFPDQSSIALDRLVGTDAAGYAGLEDGVDWHWRRLFAGAALSTLLGVSAELAEPSSGESGTVIVAAQESAQESVNQVGQEMTRRNLDIQPTLTVRPGFPLRIRLNKDVVLRPYPR